MFEKLFGDNKPGEEQNHDHHDHSGEGEHLPPELRRIKEMLSKEFGKDISVHQLGGGSIVEAKMSSGRGDSHQRILKKIDGLVEVISYVAKEKKVKPICVDATGKELAVGDVLKVPGGDKKTVLSIGFRFCHLSRTDDQTKDDGVWYELEIKDFNFIKQ